MLLLQRGLALCWGRSSAGRAPALQAGGRRFDPVRLHQAFACWVLAGRHHGEGCCSLCLRWRGWVERLQEIGCVGVGLCKARGLLARLYGVVLVGMISGVCSLVIVNLVLVRFWARRTTRVALGSVCACRMLGSGVVWRGPWFGWHGCLTQAVVF